MSSRHAGVQQVGAAAVAALKQTGTEETVAAADELSRIREAKGGRAQRGLDVVDTSAIDQERFEAYITLMPATIPWSWLDAVHLALIGHDRQGVEQFRAGRTGADGGVVFSDLPAGDYDVRLAEDVADTVVSDVGTLLRSVPTIGPASGAVKLSRRLVSVEVRPSTRGDVLDLDVTVQAARAEAERFRVYLRRVAGETPRVLAHVRHVAVPGDVTFVNLPLAEYIAPCPLHFGRSSGPIPTCTPGAGGCSHARFRHRVPPRERSEPGVYLSSDGRVRRWCAARPTSSCRLAKAGCPVDLHSRWDRSTWRSTLKTSRWPAPESNSRSSRRQAKSPSQGWWS